MVPVKWSKEALANLKEIKQYIAYDSAYYAQRLVSYIITACKLLQDHPEAGRPLTTQKGMVLRRINIKSFQVVYTYHNNQVFIIAVAHQARQTPGSFNIDEIIE